MKCVIVVFGVAAFLFQGAILGQPSQAPTGRRSGASKAGPAKPTEMTWKDVEVLRFDANANTLTILQDNKETIIRCTDQTKVSFDGQDRPLKALNQAARATIVSQKAGTQWPAKSVSLTATHALNPEEDLLACAAGGNLDCVRHSLRRGAKIDSRTEFGMIPVKTTQVTDNSSYTEAIGVNGGETALILAARQGHLEVVKLLIEKSADVNAADRKGKTSLMAAREKKLNEIERVLLAAGAQ